MAAISISIASSPLTSAINYIIGSIVGGGLFYIIFILSKGKWIGGGDVRLGFLLGLLAATPARSLMLIYLASLIGVLVSVILMALRRVKRTSLIPFGPFLILALVLVQFFGQDIIHWYSHLFLGY